MGNQFVRIDEKNWKRAMHCQVFRNSVEPAFCVTFELDITNFLNKIREKKYSFTFALVYSVSVCANQIEEFRYRFLDGDVVLYDRIDTAFTYLNIINLSKHKHRLVMKKMQHQLSSLLQKLKLKLLKLKKPIQNHQRSQVQSH